MHTHSTVQAPRNDSRQTKRERSVSGLDIRRRRTYFAIVYQTSKNKTKAASGLVICNYDGHKVANTNFPPSNITLPCDMEDWEVPVSEICSWTYTLACTIAYMKGSSLIATLQIGLFGYRNVMYFRDKAMENPLNKRAVLLLACEGEVLVSTSNRITKI